LKRDKEYDPKASCSKCCSGLLNEEKCWLTTTSSSRDYYKKIRKWSTNISHWELVQHYKKNKKEEKILHEILLELKKRS
jgi:hypothetical protein